MRRVCGHNGAVSRTVGFLPMEPMEMRLREQSMQGPFKGPPPAGPSVNESSPQIRYTETNQAVDPETDLETLIGQPAMDSSGPPPRWSHDKAPPCVGLQSRVGHSEKSKTLLRFLLDDELAPSRGVQC